MLKVQDVLHSLAVACLGLAGAVFLAGCGGDGTPEPAYALTIDGPAERSTSQAEVLLTGTGFLPPDSTCPGGCAGLLPPPVFGTLGPHSMQWRNEATAAQRAIALNWICNCGGSAPSWMAQVPVSPGINAITVSMSAGGYQQEVTVRVRRN